MSDDALAQRLFNFSAGPAALPLPVLERAQAELVCLPGAGASVLEISHRSKEFVAIMESAQARVRSLLSVSDDYEVLMLQGGSRLQFSMIPMNLMAGAGAPAEYVVTGSWGSKAVDEAKKEGDVKVLWSGKSDNFRSLPDWESLETTPDAAYLYITSNETIQGVQVPADLPSSAPLVCDSSSDFLSRPVPVEKYGLIYACAQKNAGPAGVTVVIIRKDLLERASDQLPGYCLYRNHAAAGSMYNTPPTFAVYFLDLVCQWLQDDIGGLEKIHAQNQAKAKLLYDVIDAHPEFYLGHAQQNCRSLMNVTFRIADESLEQQFVAGAAEHRLDGVKGHRSVGGIRASIYNAMPVEGVEALAGYMRDFVAQA